MVIGLEQKEKNSNAPVFTEALHIYKSKDKNFRFTKSSHLHLSLNDELFMNGLIWGNQFNDIGTLFPFLNINGEHISTLDQRVRSAFN